jgi:hypothetical protein
MNNNENLTLKNFAQIIIDLDIEITSMFKTKNNDYEIVTYFDEVQVLDLEENILIRVKKNEKQS